MRNITDRHEYILKQLRLNSKVSIVDLCDEMNVSNVTIRKDLKLLEQKNLLFRTKGGASLNNPYAGDKSIVIKESIKSDEKNRIAIAAINMIKNSDAIMISSGTTAFAVANLIYSDSCLTVITPALKVAIALSNRPNIEVLQLGGLIRPNSSSVAGLYAHRILNEVSCELFILGVDGIDLEFGVTISNLTEATLNQKMIQCSQKIVIVADSTKFGRRGLGKICNIEDVDYIITDNAVANKYITTLEKMGVSVIAV